jgi:hypothetical protein
MQLHIALRLANKYPVYQKRNITTKKGKKLKLFTKKTFLNFLLTEHQTSRSVLKSKKQGLRSGSGLDPD